MNPSETSETVKGDRALSKGDADRLGFRDVAVRIAKSLIDHASDEGLVIGVEGSWGSGKSSLLYLIQAELGQLPETEQPTIINFRPWLVGNRDALLASLFETLANKIDHVQLLGGDATGVTIKKAKDTADAVRRFASRLSRFGGALEMVGDNTALPLVKIAGRGLKAVAEISDGKATEPSLAELKDKLTASLRDLGHRFIITIDDVDRLEPAEVTEVLRLTRSVADFPNVIYLLCYDSEILAASIEQAAKVVSGRAYLEKIVQLTVMVPKPEPFQLRHWFAEDLHKIAIPKNEDERTRLKTVIDFEGGRQLKTPRSVVRALDSIRFYWPPLRDERADLADLVWLQFIKDGSPALYRWLEDYCGTAAALSLGTVRVDDAEQASEVAQLNKIVGEGYFADIHYRHYFAQQLAGADVDFAKNGEIFKLYQQVQPTKRDTAIRDRRLTSPDHYRLYFALAGPSYALKQDDYDAFWKAADQDNVATGRILLDWHVHQASSGLSKTDLLLERIRGLEPTLFSPEQSRNLLLAFGNVLDKAYWQLPFDRFWVNSLWDRAERLIPSLLLRISPEDRSKTIIELFEHGEAIGWLTTLFRRDTFAQGRYGDQEKPESQWLFTAEELNLITTKMIDRYQRMTFRQVVESIDTVSLLFAWYQGGDEDGPRKLVDGQITNDSSLIRVLTALTSSINSSNGGKFDVLKRDNLKAFIGYDDARKRIEEIAAQLDKSEEQEAARRLVEAFKDGDQY